MFDYVDEVTSSWRAVRPDLDTSPIEVVSRILRAAQLIQLRLDAVIGADAALSHKGDLDTLTALRRTGRGRSLSPTTLAQVGQLTSGGMTNRLDRLEAAGLIIRKPHPDDRRSVLVSLTPLGEQSADQAFIVSLAAQADLIAAMSARERRDSAAILHDLLLALGDVPLGIAADDPRPGRLGTERRHAGGDGGRCRRLRATRPGPRRPTLLEAYDDATAPSTAPGHEPAHPSPQP